MKNVKKYCPVCIKGTEHEVFKTTIAGDRVYVGERIFACIFTLGMNELLGLDRKQKCVECGRERYL